MLHYPGWKRFLDWCLVPIMYLLQGNFREIPQRTHFWNNVRWRADWYHQPWFLSFSGDPTAVAARPLGFIPRFHMRIFGGWTKFVVLEPVEPIVDWHVGWSCDVHGSGLSLVTIDRRVRMTIGPGPVKFFGLDRNGKQIELRCVGEGRIGSAGEFAEIPLL